MPKPVKANATPQPPAPPIAAPTAAPVATDPNPPKKRSKIAEQQLKMRSQLWGILDDKNLWVSGKRTGFTTIPRTLPIMMKIMDALSSGKPVSSVYLELWCRSFNHSFVVLNKQAEMAFHSGFSGQRAVQTWISRMRILQSLRFIETKSGPSGEFSYALIWNPYLVIKYHHANNTAGFPMDLYNGLAQRAIDVGATDLD